MFGAMEPRAATRPEQPLVSRYEIAKMLGLSKERARDFIKHPTFPKPYAQLHSMDVWKTADVRRWIERRPDLRGRASSGGRPATKRAA